MSTDRIEPPVDSWWTISGEALLEALRRVERGDAAAVVYLELYANGTHERP